MGLPNSSWLNQLPQRPIAWATSTPGASASSIGSSRMPAAAGADPRRRARRARSRPRCRGRRARRRAPSIGLPARAEVEVVVGDHVVEPAADEAERHRPHREVADLARAGRRGPPSAARRSRCATTMPRMIAQRVAADRQRAEVPDALRGAGDGQQAIVARSSGSSGQDFSSGSRSCDVGGELGGGGAPGPVDRRPVVGVDRGDRGCRG